MLPEFRLCHMILHGISTELSTQTIHRCRLQVGERSRDPPMAPSASEHMIFVRTTGNHEIFKLDLYHRIFATNLGGIGIYRLG